MIESRDVDAQGPYLPNNSERWTDWGFPPRNVPRIIHHIEYPGFGKATTCCNKVPGQLPATDRITFDDEFTCQGVKDEATPEAEVVELFPTNPALEQSIRDHPAGKHRRKE